MNVEGKVAVCIQLKGVFKDGLLNTRHESVLLLYSMSSHLALPEIFVGRDT
jgi:hypothetical protein